ncbi:MAG: methyltransferase domain-containing protein [Desulfofustis sp. PB-SRB1]|jgi:ubiquinone/menaquinone biosynthesis C-methylase UbiE|nr:methyltransferase domain-containing protein [Desulfofustis sp. PB-SRB1]MBM1001873.1 methyltransferase domain-containing protein [Desulfofustis sp. PB-SRB1]
MNNNNSKPLSETAKQFYDEKYYSSATADVRVSAHLRKLAKKLDMRTGTKVLDVACGTGNWLLAAAHEGAAPFGIDISEKAIAICRRVMSDGTFVCAGADTLPFEDRVFDLVSCLGALEHFPDIARSLREIVRVGKDDARFLLLVPNSGFLTARLGLYSGTHQTEVKEEAHTISEWEAMFREAGLTVENKWRDLHVVSWDWIAQGGIRHIPVRVMQAIMLCVWPLKWQYQVYFLCRKVNAVLANKP